MDWIFFQIKIVVFVMFQKITYSFYVTCWFSCFNNSQEIKIGHFHFRIRKYVEEKESDIPTTK